jgi:hypothetical protein
VGEAARGAGDREYGDVSLDVVGLGGLCAMKKAKAGG